MAKKTLSWTKEHMRATVNDTGSKIQLNVVNMRNNASVLSTECGTWEAAVSQGQEALNEHTS